MNKQGKLINGKVVGGIEWTKTFLPDGTERQGYTWNPTGGCLHGCTWQMPDGAVAECYAKTVAERLATKAYDQGFEHHYWRPRALDEPFKVKTPAKIFVGSMADLFGHWVPEVQIRAALAVMTQADWHTFQTLSKYPLRLPQFNPFPPNVWVGVSLPAGHLMKPEGAKRALWAYLEHMEKIEATVRFMSIEPLWFDASVVLSEYVVVNGKLPFEWAIIGAASNGPKTFQPEPGWVQRLMWVLDGGDIPVFFKGNLDWSPRREEFPGVAAESEAQS